MFDRDTIVRIAELAGFTAGSYDIPFTPGPVHFVSAGPLNVIDPIERFALMIESDTRERCARQLDHLSMIEPDPEACAALMLAAEQLRTYGEGLQ